MKLLTINEDVPDRGAEEGLRQKIDDLVGGLSVEFRLETDDDAARLELRGEDEEAAYNLLSEELRIAPEIAEGAVFVGRLVEPGEVGFGIFVDTGEEQVLLPLRRLREALGEGEGSVRNLAGKYGLIDGLPVEVEVVDGDGEAEVELTDAEAGRLKDRQREGILLVSGATKSRLKRALSETGAARGVSRIERLGLTFHAVHTTAGTDPVGLIPEIGPALRGAVLEAVGD